MLLKQEQPTAGQQPWSEEGLELLRVIHNEIRNSQVTDLPTEHSICFKENCYFCEKMGLLPAKPRPVEAIANTSVHWTVAEKQIIRENFLLGPRIIQSKFLKNRSINGIIYKRRAVARKMGYKWVGNKYVKVK